MCARDRFLRGLYERTGGRTDRTVHAYLHVAIPHEISLAEMRAAVAALADAGLVEVDPGFDRLIRLTPAGVAACQGVGTADRAAPAAREPVVTWHGFAVPREMYAGLAAAAGN